MPGKSAFYWMLVLGIICLADGIAKRDVKEIMIALATLTYTVIRLAAGSKKGSSTATECNPRQ